MYQKRDGTSMRSRVPKRVPETLISLKAGLLLFWFAWFAVVFTTNALGGLRAARRLPQSWRFASKNYEAVVKAVSVYEAPAWLPALLFTGVLAWQLAAAALFLAAFVVSCHDGHVATAWADAAFATGIALWGAFMLADEITIKYTYEQSHELLFIAQLASLVAIHVL
ncbi:MAG: hypothetical protein ACM3X5_00540 [Bacillota bacterium]